MKETLPAGEHQLTPLMQQYCRIKAKLPEGTLLLYRLGDFFEAFFDDAVKLAKAANIALTKRNGVPMAGIPVHAQDYYLKACIGAGYQVALVDTFSDPNTGESLKAGTYAAVP